MSEQETAELAALTKEMRGWLKMRPHSRIVDIRKHLRHLANIKYPVLSNRSWSNGWISSLKTKLGHTKHSLKVLGMKKSMARWLKIKQSEPFSKITSETFKNELKKISKSIPSRTKVRELRKALGYDLVFDKATKSEQKWEKKEKEI